MTTDSPEKCILGVLASGGGSNFRAIDDAIRSGRLQEAEIGVVLSDREDAGALEIARQRDIPAHFLEDVDNNTRNQKIQEWFREYGVEMGIGAGYLKLVGANVLNACRYGVLNIHPGPLYRYGGQGMHGLKVHQAVIDAGEKWSGPTVHLMDEVYDNGQILAHAQVPVLSDDTPEALAARILPYEHDLYWRVIGQQIRRGPHPED